MAMVKPTPTSTDELLFELRRAIGVPGLSFRRFAGDADFATMARVSCDSWKADHVEWVESKGDVTSEFQYSKTRDPHQDVLFAEVDGEVIGFGEVGWTPKDQGTTVYWHRAHLLEGWRGKGIREALLRFNERRIEEIARGHPEARRKILQTWAMDEPNDWRSIILAAGYAPVWSILEMVRPNLEDIPNIRIPEGLELRGTRPQDYRLIWEARREAYRDEPWFSESAFDENHFQAWVHSSRFMPDLWQVAWHGDDIAGMVENFVLKDFNRILGRRRGFTEGIFVRPPYRGKGLAKALIARSLDVHRGLGMQEVSLDVNAANPYKAARLYEKMGYRVVKRFTFHQKPL